MNTTRIATPPVGRPEFVGSVLNALSLLYRRVVKSIEIWSNRRQILRLAGADDRLLEDIGLTRADIDWALMQPLHVDPSELLSERVKCRRAAGRWAHKLTAPDTRR